MPTPKLTAALACTLLCTALFAQQKGTFTDTRDGKIYKTTKIGEQVWMAENLNYEAEGSRCYKDKKDYCNYYGRLYNWEMAKTACPSGWHLPDSLEWKVLVTTAGGDTIAGKYLKAAISWKHSTPNEDKFGFSALAGGGGNFLTLKHLGKDGLWHLDSSDNRNFNFFRGFRESGYWWSYNGRLYMSWNGNEAGFHSSDNEDNDNDNDRVMYSIRCLQDTPAPPKGEAK